eukprot:9262592-Alexandrium_andersonii.AAC.1
MLSRTCCRQALDKRELLPELGVREAPPDAVPEGALEKEVGEGQSEAVPEAELAVGVGRDADEDLLGEVRGSAVARVPESSLGSSAVRSSERARCRPMPSEKVWMVTQRRLHWCPVRWRRCR